MPPTRRTMAPDALWSTITALFWAYILGRILDASSPSSGASHHSPPAKSSSTRATTPRTTQQRRSPILGWSSPLDDPATFGYSTEPPSAGQNNKNSIQCHPSPTASLAWPRPRRKDPRQAAHQHPGRVQACTAPRPEMVQTRFRQPRSRRRGFGKPPFSHHKLSIDFSHAHLAPPRAGSGHRPPVHDRCSKLAARRRRCVLDVRQTCTHRTQWQRNAKLCGWALAQWRSLLRCLKQTPELSSGTLRGNAWVQ